MFFGYMQNRKGQEWGKLLAGAMGVCVVGLALLEMLLFVTCGGGRDATLATTIEAKVPDDVKAAFDTRYVLVDRSSLGQHRGLFSQGMGGAGSMREGMPMMEGMPPPRRR